MALDAGTAFVDVLPRVTSFGSALSKGIGPQLGVAEKQVSGFSSVAKTAFAAAGLAAVAFVASSIKAYQEHQTVVAQLQHTISRTPTLAGASTKAFEDQATALQNLTGFEDEQVLAADNVLARFGLTKTQLNTIIPLTLDYARATGKDATDAAVAIGRALGGNLKALKAIGIQYTSTGDKAKDFTNIVQLLNQKVGGTAAVFGTTSAGKIEIFQAKLNDVQEVLGQAVLPALDQMVSALSALLPILVPVVRNAALLVAAFLGFKVVEFVPELLGLIARGLAHLGLEETAVSLTKVSYAAESMSAAFGPIVLATTLAGVAVVQSVNAQKKAVTDAAALIQKYGATSKQVHEAILHDSVAGGKYAGLEYQSIHDRAVQAAKVLPDLVAAQNTARFALQTEGTQFDINTGQVSDNTLALIENRAAVDGLTDGLLGIVNAHANLTQAQRTQAEAQRQVNKDIKDGKKGTQQYRDDLNALHQAQLGNINAQEAQRQSVTKYAQQITGPVKAANDQLNKDIAKYGENSTQAAADTVVLQQAHEDAAAAEKKAIAQLDEEARKAGLSKAQIKALNQQLRDYIGNLDDIPSSKTTDIYTRFHKIGQSSASSAQQTTVTGKGGLFARFAAGRAFTTPFGAPFIAGEAAYPTPLGVGGELVNNRGVLPLSKDIIDQLGRSIAEAAGGWQGRGGPIVVKVMIDRREIGRAVVAEEQWRR